MRASAFFEERCMTKVTQNSMLAAYTMVGLHVAFGMPCPLKR
jgi:hypothetical protein